MQYGRHCINVSVTQADKERARREKVEQRKASRKPAAPAAANSKPAETGEVCMPS
jgi:hypothetical protein